MSLTNDVAMNDSGYDRIPLDFYPSPPWITQIIANYIDEEFPSWGKDGYDDEMILEPACGEGHMSKVLETYGYKVDSYDLVDRGYGLGGVNFLTNQWDMSKYIGIVTNPPYGDMAKAFIRHGMNLIRDTDCFMMMILRNEFDCSKGVMDIFNDPLYHGKIVLTKRPLWIEPKEGEKSGSPRHCYSIYIWAAGRNLKMKPTIEYAHPTEIVLPV